MNSDMQLSMHCQIRILVKNELVQTSSKNTREPFFRGITPNVDTKIYFVCSRIWYLKNHLKFYKDYIKGYTQT